MYPGSFVQSPACSQAVDRVDLLEKEGRGLVDGGYEGPAASGEAIQKGY